MVSSQQPSQNVDYTVLHQHGLKAINKLNELKIRALKKGKLLDFRKEYAYGKIVEITVSDADDLVNINVEEQEDLLETLQLCGFEIKEKGPIIIKRKYINEIMEKFNKLNHK